MAASFSITVNIPTCDTRRAEVAHAARSALREPKWLTGKK